MANSIAIDARDLKPGDMLDRGVKYPREVVRARQTVSEFAGMRCNVVEVLHKHPATGELVLMNFGVGAKAKVFK